MPLRPLSATRAIAVPLALLAIGCGLQFAGFLGLPLAKAATAAPAASVMPPAPIEVQLRKAESDGLIFDRQQIMKGLNDSADLLGQIVAGEVPPDKLAATTKAIAQGAHDSAAAFRQKIPGGRAKPEVWTNWTDYAQRMDAFVRNADELARVGQKGDLAAVSSTLGDALPCKQCHDVYRVPKK